MTAKVVIEYTVENVCNPDDFGQDKPFKTFHSIVDSLITEEGIFGIANDEYKIISISQVE